MKPGLADQAPQNPPLPKAPAPLSPAHVELLKLIATHIVEDYIAERDNLEEL
ncbi:MAG: hypothetical protein H8K07_20365 [Nitrospira sp.]|nr:hypothetical protein [Nitrospira sp.]